MCIFITSSLGPKSSLTADLRVASPNGPGPIRLWGMIMNVFLLPLTQEGLFLVKNETSIGFSSKSDVLHPLWCQKDPNFTKCNLKIKKCDF